MFASFKCAKCWITVLAEKSSEQYSRNRASVNLMIESLEKVVDEQVVN